MTFLDRLALANCAAFEEMRCSAPCQDCRLQAAAVAHELADWLTERFGHSETAELIRGALPEVPDAAIESGAD